MDTNATLIILATHYSQIVKANGFLNLKVQFPMAIVIVIFQKILLLISSFLKGFLEVKKNKNQ
jgi:hypothetical protein